MAPSLTEITLVAPMLDLFIMDTATKLDGPKRSLWSVSNNYRLRTASYILISTGLALHMASVGAATLTWTLLLMHFLLLPHLLYWRAMRAPDPSSAELANLLIDALLIGVWIGALHFPLWPSFSMAIGCMMNITNNRGGKGVLPCLLALSTGILAGIGLAGFSLSPHTTWPTTAFCIVGIALYLITTANVSNRRNQQLRAARENLRLGEQALQQQLAEIQVLQAKLKEQAVHDALTGLFNRRYLDTIVPHELARCARDRAPLCLMMMDIDHFKQVNDTYGHQGGDEVLKALAQLLTDSVRASDVACRYGGEEFLLVLPNMPVENALLRAEQWRASFAALAVEFAGACIESTVSIGIACFPDDGCDPAVLIRCADLALYRAKALGRNQVVLFATQLVPA